MNVHATLAETGARPRLLMCPPRHFAVTYSINPWMDPRAWAGDGQLHADAERQWAALHEALIKAGAAVETMEPAADRPDLVFTANAAVVLDRKAVLSRFRHRERRDEEPIFAAAFAVLAQRGLLDEVSALPDGMILEGAGDCIWDPRRRLFWLGCGFRSDVAAAPILERQLGHRCLPLSLADACFYHLDTALCALPCGTVIYYPAAFTPPRPGHHRSACRAGAPHRARSRRCRTFCRQCGLHWQHDHTFELQSLAADETRGTRLCDR